MTLRTFVCCALAAPMLVPVLAWPLLHVEQDPFDGIAQVLVGSGVLGAVPYLVFAVGFAEWARGRTAAELQRAALRAPLLFLAPFAAFWVLLVALSGGTGAALMVLGLCAFAVALGYAYVLVAQVAYLVLSRRGMINSGTA